MSPVRWVGRASALLLVAGCPRHLGPGTTDDLTGLTLQLRTSPSLRLSVDGAVDATAAEVIFDVAGPLTRVSTGCFDSSPASGGQVRVPRPDGAFDTLAEVRLSGLSFGGIRYRAVTAGLVTDGQCFVVLGNDVLSPYALSVDVGQRQLEVWPSRPREQYSKLALHPPSGRAGFEAIVLEVTKDPQGDWPLVPVRLHQGRAELTGTFLLSSADAQSSLDEGVARANGLKPGFELLAGLTLPEGMQVPTELEVFRGITYDSLELAPGIGVRDGTLKALQAPAGQLMMGVIGGDVWGRFDAIIDVRAGVLFLSRPRVVSPGSQQRCERGGVASEEACYQLEVARGPKLVATGTVWRALPEGGRLHLDFLGEHGQRLSPPCRLGFSFPATDRGSSTQLQLPWDRLAEVMPACAAALDHATAVELSLFEDGSLPECPGTCAFARDLRSNRVTCECQPQAGGVAGDAERRFLRMYQELLEHRGVPGLREVEPDDPDDYRD